MHDRLLQHIRELVPINDDEADLITRAFVPTALRKKEFLLPLGAHSNHMRFVDRGCVKVCSVDDRGVEHVLQFGIPGWWVNDLYAFLTGKPSVYSIQAITDSVLLQVHRDTLEELYDQVPMIDRFFRIKTQNGYVALQERTIQQLSTPAEDRYLELVDRYRSMEQQIPQYMIASYLGVTPEHLSAIRKKINDARRS
jgi:CRP-like cAMP-binding protein